MKIPTSIENWVVDGMTPKQVRHVKPVLPARANGRLADIYAQIRRDFQLVPPLTMFSPAPELLSGVWSIWRETQFAVGKVARPFTEAVAAAVSRINDCPYCVDAHTGMLHASSDHDVADAILRDCGETITDPRMRKTVKWAVATLTPDDGTLKQPPFTRDEAPEMIGTAVVYHFVNRMVNIFLPPTPMPVPAGSQGMRRLATQVFGATVGKNIAARKPVPGESLRFIPESALPDDLAWASSNASVAVAFAGCAKILELAGERALPGPVRDLFHQQLRSWRGNSMGIGRHWLEKPIADLSDQHKPAARLTLLTALAPHQVDDTIIRSFRESQAGELELLEATAWASFFAARRIGSWLTLPQE